MGEHGAYIPTLSLSQPDLRSGAFLRGGIWSAMTPHNNIMNSQYINSYLTENASRGLGKAMQTHTPGPCHASMQTVLHALPESVLDLCDGLIWETMRKGGRDGSPRSLINSWNCWGITVGELLEQLRLSADDEGGTVSIHPASEDFDGLVTQLEEHREFWRNEL